MANPGGNYPGRQISLGRTRIGEPAFVYFVSGRSAKSRERHAAPYLEDENAIRMKPVDPHGTFDPFRHYQAVRIDPETGLLLVSNSHAPNDALFEAFKFMGGEERHEREIMQRLMYVIGPEYDNPEKPTSRVTGVIIPSYNYYELCVTPRKNFAFAWNVDELPGNFTFAQTYDGNVDYQNFDPHKLTTRETVFQMDARDSQGLADELYEMSDYIDSEYGDLRVCVIAGVRNGMGPGGWELARRNRFKPQGGE